MLNILITGSNGFIGRNLDLGLRCLPDCKIEYAFSSVTISELQNKVQRADVVYHLAGANRPINESDFQHINVDVTRTIVNAMREVEDKPQTIFYSSSIQATSENAYGRSKKQAEELVETVVENKRKAAKIYRLPNVFGKWSRPNYNSAVATFCHNIARGLPIAVADPDRSLKLVYIDDVVREWISQLGTLEQSQLFYEVKPILRCTLGQLVTRIQAIHDMRTSLHVPDLSDPLNFALHATYTSFLDESDLSRPVLMRTDERGWLFELTKSLAFGQVFVSTTKPGVTRGNHYHDSKIERFCLVKGTGLIRFRKVGTEKVLEYLVEESEIRIVDIPPGYTHSIENIGNEDMLVLFWSNEIFDPAVPDTNFEKVLS